MKKCSLSLTLTGALMLCIALVACRKDRSAETLTPKEEEQIAVNSTHAEAEGELYFNDVFDNVVGVNNEVGLQGTGIFGGRLASGDLGRIENIDSVPRCVKVTIEKLNAPEKFPMRITTDFGTAGCTGRDGRTRFGKMVTTYTGRLIESGKSATTSFDGYRIDSTTIEGTHVITNTSTHGSIPPQRQFTTEVSGKLSRPSGNYSEYKARRVITQVEGLITPLLPVDDVFTITGQASGTVKRGGFISTWESEIVEPLRKRFNCRWVTKGIVKVVRRNLSSTSPWISILDYGNGTCDAFAKLTVNGVTHEITLR